MNGRLVLAILLPFLALALQWVLWPWIAPFVWFLFFPAVFFSARLGGLWGGLVSTVLSAVLVWFFFIPPQLSWKTDNPPNIYSVVLFLGMGYLFSDTQERLRRTQRNADTALVKTRAANEKITQLYQQTLELDKLKSQFFANISHELRTPLTLILSPLSRRLSQTGLPEAQRREDEMMIRNARLLYRHVSDLLDTAKLESGHMAVDYACVEIGSLTRTMASQFDYLAREKSIDYRIDVPIPLEAEVDSEKMQRILLNLLSNTFKFTPEGGRIEVRLREEANQVIIEVQDNGPGVPDNMLEAVFDRFRQVDGGAQRHFGGTGLGLAIVKEFAQLHGGSASVAKAAGGGALFVVRLPLHAPAGAIIHSMPSLLDPVINHQAVDELRSSLRNTVFPVNTQAGANAPLVLVVEDNADMNAFIANTLSPYYRIACAFDGREGLEQALALQPDLILSDVMMPHLSGDQMVQELRQKPGLADVPIVMLTAKADDDLRVRLLKEGVQDYLNKPFSVEEMLARVGGLIKERRRTQTELHRYEQIVATSGDMLAFVDCERQFLVVNPAYAGLYSAAPADLWQQQVADVVGVATYALIAHHLDRALSGEIQRFTIDPVFPDGKQRVLDAEYRPFRQDGEIQGVVVSLRDITDIKASEEALKVSEVALKMAQRLAGVGNWQWDIQTNVQTWSEEIYRIYGRDPALPPATYSEVQQYFTPESWARLAAAVEKGLAEGVPYECDAEVVRYDGTHRWIVARGEATRAADGKVINLHGTVQDISERKQAEIALREREQKLSAIIYYSPSVLSLKHPDGRYALANPNLQLIHKLTEDEIIGKTDFDLYPEETARVFRANDELVLSTLVRHSIEEIVPVDGQSRIFMSHIFPVLGEEGVVQYVCRISLDVTARRQTEEALRASEERLKLALDATSDGLWDWDLRSGVVYRSPHYYELIGRRPDQGTQDFEFFITTVHPDDLPHALEAIEAHKQGKTAAIEFDYRLANYSGGMKWMRKRGRAVERDAGGAALRIVGTLSDITVYKQAEEEILQLNADLERRVVERTTELTAANRELDSFAYAVSHDLRAPLRAMSGFSQALVEDYGDQLRGEAMVYLDQINLASRKMSELIDGLLALSRSTRGELQYNTVDLSALSERLLAELMHSDPERQVAVQVEAGLQAYGDARMIEAVMRNLLGNSWKYTAHAAAPSIRVYAEERDSIRRFCVADNGAGFDMAHANRLFQPFQRLHRQDEFPGIGIGLATVQRIVHHHGGSIEAQGEPGKGAVFYFTLSNQLADSTRGEKEI